MNRRRVKITGIGPVTPAGVGREQFWKGIQEPVSRVRPYNKLGADQGPLVAAYLDDDRIAREIGQTRLPKGVARQSMFAIAGCLLALRDADIGEEDLRAANCAIVTGSSIMDFGGIMGTIDSVYKHGPRGARPRTIFTAGISTAPTAVAEALGINARTMVMQSACCGGLDAIGSAARMVAEGEVDLALCGGTEAPLHRFPLLELRAAELTPQTTDMPERLDRPFDLWRTTGVVSEGASMFVIEPETSRRPGYCYISGYAFANDQPDHLLGGLVTSTRLALADARVRPAAIETINAWGPGHKLIDVAEYRAMAEVFGPALEEIPVMSIKGAVGTPLAAAPAIQVAAAALAQREGTIPPTVNWERPDPACPMNLSKTSRAVRHGCTLINAHGLGGLNASMVLGRC